MDTNYKKTFRQPWPIMVFCLLLPAVMSSQVRFTEEQWILPTWKVGAPDRNPMFFRGESYQGASKVIYPYGLMDVISDEKADRPWKALILENEYIKLCVTPEIGGKLYYATDKTNGYNFIYKNNVVRPSNIGMLGAWVSGGIEWCVLHHHRASTFLPVDYEMSENPDGSKTIFIGETEPRHRMRWTIAITLFPGKTYFKAEVKIHNPTPFTHSFLYWANVAAHTGWDYQVIFPPSVKIATYHAKNVFTRWPFSTEFYNGQDFTAGVDISWWKNSPGANSFFAWDLKEDFMGGYDHGREAGTVHIADHNIVKGAKLWEWGSGPRGQATEARLTENDGPYVEIMTGAFSDNQPDYSWIRPYEVKTFRQYWYPVKGIGGFKNANLNGALNLEKRDDKKTFIGFCPTSGIPSVTIKVTGEGATLLEESVAVSPAAPYTRLINLKDNIRESDLYAEVKDNGTGEILISYKPSEKKPVAELPETVKRPPAPSEIKTVEELFLTGNRVEQFYNPTLNAMDYYSEALGRDLLDSRTNTAVGNTYLKNGDYLNARKHFAAAIRRIARDYTRPSDCEAFYLQGLTLRALGLPEEAEDTLFRATWDYAWHSAATLELARISASERDYVKALELVERSLTTNSVNNSAICLKASLQRRLADFSGALKTIEMTRIHDPLDFRAANEEYLIHLRAARPDEAEKVRRQLEKNMRDFSQNYLELAAGYMNDGLFTEAGDVLRRFKGSDPIITYYLGYLEDKKGDSALAGDLFRKASAMPTDNVFPFRLETLKVLETAASYNPSDSRAWYYSGNILYDKQPEKAISFWEKAVECDPSMSIAWRNLGWGYFYSRGDGQKAISAYEKAMALNRQDAIWYEEMDALYEMSNAPVEKRLALFEGSNDIVKKRDDAFSRQIEVLVLAGKPDKAVEYLEGRKFSYREGDARVRDIIIDAHLMMGKKYLEEKNAGKALEQFLLAKVPEEEASESRSGNRNIQVNYYTGLAYEESGNRKKASECFKEASSAEMRSISYLGYYQGLSCIKTGNKSKAEAIFKNLVEEGNRRTAGKPDIDFFSKFGAQEAENARLSNGYLMIGLGYKGLGNNPGAKENLKRAVELSAGNLWAKSELPN